MASGTTLSDLFTSSRRLTLELREGLERLERLEVAHSSPRAHGTSPRIFSSPDLTQSLKSKLGELQRLSAEMDRMWRTQVAKGQREIWKRKLEQVAEEADSLKLGLDKYMGREHSRQMEVADRADLMRRTTGDAGRALQEFDAEAQAMQSAKQSSRYLDEAIETGVNILAKYGVQRDRLKAAQRKALDILNTVGLSSSLLRAIDRRQYTDRWIAYGGMILTLIVVIAVWRWTH
eukprot:TRINITY_DN20950_c0_g1_i1.p1 TRINITY_DN20950_c0_g1~~TRINITY_DN20950_c0_g1_i1.p1  ORF type:complete len:233 (+),score=42.90 TRINITY_DN20950_c0_g1_i1:91-789(+)